MSSNYLTVILLTVTINSANSIFLPSNLMLESFNSKIPVYNSLSRILETTVLGSSNINISVPTLIIVVLVNVVIGELGAYDNELLVVFILSVELIRCVRGFCQCQNSYHVRDNRNS